MKLFMFSFLILLSTLFWGQNIYLGKVIDSETKEPLPFVNIRIGSSQNGFTTDIDGIFEYESGGKIENFEFSYLGYEKLEQTLQVAVQNTVYLIKNSIGLEEVIVDADYNPALPIIKKVIRNRRSNNPEKNLDFYYESYNKLTLGAELDSSGSTSEDSSYLMMQEFFAKQNLMLIETVVETYHKAPNKTKDIVIATRTSGLQNTMLPMLATELQAFSFYNTFFTLSNVQYISPITNEGFSKYNYKLLDEYVENADTVFVVSFWPKEKRVFKAMEGVLNISSDKYGLKNVIAKPVNSKGSMDIQINQKYQKINDVWFPEQLNSNLTFRNLSVGGLDMIGKSVSYLKNINLNPSDDELKFGDITLEMDIKNKMQNDSSLSNSRHNPLSLRDSLTYQVIDSIGEELHLDEKLLLMESLLDGRLPLGPIDLDVKKTFGYSKYEGFRLGAGLFTNDRLTKKMNIGGYFGYGITDKAWKYGGELDVKLWPKKGVGLNVSFANDISQSGSMEIGTNEKLGSNQDLYRFYTTLYDQDINWKASLRFRVKGVKAKIIGKIQRLTPLYNYQFEQITGENTVLATSEFFYSLIGVELRYSPFSKVMYNGSRLVDISSKYPVFNLSFQQTIPYLTTNEFQRLLVKVTDNFSLPFLGKSNFALIGGIVSQEVPFSYLFNQQGTKENFELSVFESFETMYVNEFYASAFINAFWEHNFGTLLKKGMFQPELAIYQGVGFGDKAKVNYHSQLEGKTMEKGFYESGLKIHNIIRASTSGFGFGMFYRYGPYLLDKQQDNFTYKITISLGF